MFSLVRLILFGAVLTAAQPALADGSLKRVTVLLQKQVEQCWAPPRQVHLVTTKIAVTVKLAKDGSVLGEPEVSGKLKTPINRAFAASLVQAILRCQPYTILVESGIDYDSWSEMQVNAKLPRF